MLKDLKNFVIFLTVAAGVALLAAACGSGNSDNTPTPVGTPSVTPSSTPTPFVTINSPVGYATQNVPFVVTATFAVTTNITFSYATTNGTAVSGTDYTATSGTGTILAGLTSTTIQVPTALSSIGKTFSMTISSPSANAQLGAPVTGSVTPQGIPAFTVDIYSIPDGVTSPTPNLEAHCSIPQGSATYGAPVVCTNAAGAGSGVVVIPEGRLYFSQLQFTITVGENAGSYVCYRGVFRPYYYLANNSNKTFTSPWNTSSIDCTASPTPAACYGGMAGDVVPGFPNFGGVYFIPTGSTSSFTWTSKSANSHSYLSNRYAVNNLAALGAPITFTHANVLGDAFVGGAGNYQEYSFHCADTFDESIYSFSLTLVDQDQIGVYPNVNQSNPAINQFPDWDPAAWDR